MMKRRLVYTSRFKKDLKRYRNDPKRRAKIVATLALLASGDVIPKEMRPHNLIGNYAGHMEMHIEGDLLLIWMETNDDGETFVYLVRLGSHSDLF